MSDQRGRLTRDRFRVFTAAEIEPDDLIHWMGDRYFVLDARRDGDEMIVDTRDGTLEIPFDEEVAINE
jgi:hypothetical protein